MSRTVTGSRGWAQAWILWYLAYLLLAYLLGVVAVELSARGENTAPWWPAAGAAVLALLVVPARYRLFAALGLVVVTGFSNYVAGRPADLSLAFGLANAAEAVVVSWLLTRNRGRFRLQTVGDTVVLLVATAAGAATIGLLVGTSVVLLAGGQFVATAVSVVAGHGSAVLSLVPIAAPGPRRSLRAWGQVRWLQPVALAAVVLVVFWPGHYLPLAFLPMPFLVWGAFVFPTRQVAIQLLAVATTVTTLTVLGGGPFGGVQPWSDLQRSFVVQSFLVTYAASILFLAAARSEQRHLAVQVTEREQLLRGGILDAQVGLVIMHEDGAGATWIVQSNPKAVELLGPTVPLVQSEPDDEGVPLKIDGERPATAFLEAIERTREALGGEWSSEFSTGGEDGRQVQLNVTRVPRPSGEALLTMQVLDITERHRADRAVRRALRDERLAATELRAINRQKDDFVSAVSHELRSPITSIVGFVEVLQDEGELAPEQREYLEIVDRNARRLGVLVEDLLALGSSADRPPERMDVPVAVEQVIEDQRPAAQARDVQLRLGAAADCEVTFVAEDLVRILTNLVGNAIKFTPPRGNVSVEVFLNQESCTLRVVDTGPGIPQAELDHVFERFYRSVSAKEDSVPGVGLGLSLVRELAHRNASTVRLLSDGASGTVAELVIPLAADTRLPAQDPS